MDALSTINFLTEIFARFGFPRSLTADNGPQFKSTEFADFCKCCQIKLINTTPYWPQHNGEVERQNRTILKRLAISQNMNQDWRKDLVDFLIMYRSTPHSILKKTPSELLFGWNIRDKLPRFSESNNFANEEVQDRDKLEKEKGRQYSDRKRRAQQSNLTVGDTVLIRNQHKTNKLSPEFENTDYEVVEVRTGGVVVENKETKKRFLRNPAHIKRIGGNLADPLEIEDDTDVDGIGSDNGDEFAPDNDYGIAHDSENERTEELTTNHSERPNTTTERQRRVTKAPHKFKDYQL